MKKIVNILTALFLMSGCNQQAKIDQSDMCVYSTDEEAKQCKKGEMALFKPSRWGNEQLPILAAASYCDFNYEVMYNNAGLICVFTDERISE